MPEPEPVTEEEFRRLCDFLYRRTGMVFTEAKRYYVQRRVTERMAATGSASFPSYFARLRSDLRGEVEQFINAFTVNETYFYREDHQLRCLTSDLLPQRVRAKRRGDPVRIWSVPCSTGEEPYSVAIWLLENWPDVDAWDIEIVGSDIDTRALQAAEAGEFGKRALMRLPPEIVGRYFERLDEDRWRIIDDLRGSVRFTPVNLVDPEETRPHGRFDVIFCRNVLIYFDRELQNRVHSLFYESLVMFGNLAMGSKESLRFSQYEPCYEKLHPKEKLYRKVK